MSDFAIAEAPAAVVVRPARPEDLDAVAGIYTPFVSDSLVTFELEPPDRAEWLRRHEHVTAAGLPFLLAEVDGRAAGYAYCTPWRTRPAYHGTVEDSIYVAPWAAGRGIGGRLLDALLTACGQADVRQVLAVVVDTGDPASVALHRSRGFTDAGRLRGVGVKHGRTLDTVLLQRSLVSD
ncbi:GNAT family N-acetyltransferase [Pseudonocardia nigra]|uniref:GNAT family N-acetyltransferase n=1 Tax=Pseudonocardia nigra TaxID=1921578 RepID=UPI0027E2378A|nr:N-acetyltransferase family protein [Pseudonocardia nigra]